MGRRSGSSPDITMVVGAILSILLLFFAVWLFFFGGMQVIGAAAPLPIK